MRFRKLGPMLLCAAVTGATLIGGANPAMAWGKGNDGLGRGNAAIGIACVMRSAQPETLDLGNSAGALGSGPSPGLKHTGVQHAQSPQNQASPQARYVHQPRHYVPTQAQYA